MTKWYNSLKGWRTRYPNGDFGTFDLKIRDMNITGFPAGRGRNLEEFSDWFCSHVKKVRNLVPSHRLVEIDLEDPRIGIKLEEIFGIDKSCWGRANINPRIHPEFRSEERR